MNIFITILAIVLIGILLLFLGFLLLIFIMKKKAMSKTKEDIIKFMEKNPEMWSMTLIQNDREIINYNKDKIFPLASTVKILYVVAFVHAVRNKSLNPDDIIPIKEVDSLYLHNTDGNAHNTWKENEQIGVEVTLKEIAKGMIKYSSNACTDFIYYKLGKDKIEEVIREYSLSHHIQIYPLNAALLIPSYLNIEEKVEKKAIVQTVKDMPSSQFNLLATEMLTIMIKGEANRFIENLSILSDMNIQRELTKKFPAASSFDYAKLMYELGEKGNLTTEDKQLMDDLMGFADYQNDGLRKWYKGGSTLFVSTSASFISNDTDTISFTFFVEDMSGMENIWIQKNYNAFIKAFLNEPLFRTKVLHVVEMKDQTA